MCFLRAAYRRYVQAVAFFLIHAIVCLLCRSCRCMYPSVLKPTPGVMESPDPLDSELFEQFFWFVFSAGFVFLVGDTSLRWISGFPEAKYRRLLANAASVSALQSLLWE